MTSPQSDSQDEPVDVQDDDLATPDIVTPTPDPWDE
jgi:hypothetical protein